MSTIRQEGAESPEVSLESQRRAMLHNAVRNGQNSLFNYFGFATLDAEGMQERGIAYPQPHMPIVPNIAQVAPAAPQQVQYVERPMQPQSPVEQPTAVQRPVVPAEQSVTAPAPERPVALPVQPAPAQVAPRPVAPMASTPEAPVHESSHMIDARAKVEAAFAEMQLEAQPEQSVVTRQEDYDLAA